MSQINEQYTDEESAFARAFGCGGALCTIQCKCGRLYFVSARGHGDYLEGELEELKRRAAVPGSRVYECDQFHYIDHVPMGGSDLVIQCECGAAKQYIDWLELELPQIVEYARIRLQQKRKRLADELTSTDELLGTAKANEIQLEEFNANEQAATEEPSR